MSRDKLKNKEAPLLLLNLRMAQQLPPVLNAAIKHYKPIGKLLTASEEIVIMVPQNEGEAP